MNDAKNRLREDSIEFALCISDVCVISKEFLFLQTKLCVHRLQ